MQNFTHLEFLELTKNENDIKSLLSLEVKEFTPKNQTISNILNYSKALNIRKSENIEFIELVLN